MIRYALLIETVSIQQYIFSSNKLKENIGASYIIEHLVFGKGGIMDEVIEKMFSKSFDCEEWKQSSPNDNGPCFIGYFGGGNVLLFFEDVNNVTLFVKEFSKRCLLTFPTLRFVFGLKEQFDINNYKAEYKLLTIDLQKNKSSYIPITSIPKHGITADCPWSNETAEYYEVKSKQYISSASMAKLWANELAATNLNKYFKVDEHYTFTDEIDQLGQEKEGSYIAVVHIDGNGMGKIFSNINSLSELRKKSIAVSNKALEAMRALIDYTVTMIKQGKLKNLSLKHENENTEKEKTIIPIRPILVGGDDITFICEGRTGVHLAEKFIEFFYDDTERKKLPTATDKLMDGACAGIAIVKTHFPFYKAVKLAEDLCFEAKEKSRSDGKCYISYYYSASTFSGKLNLLRQRTHKCGNKSAYFGPYQLFDGTQKKSIEELKKGIGFFNDKDKWPQNKVMRLREVIAGTQTSQELFEKEIKEIGITLPRNKSKIWEEGCTPYFDQIELMEFYLPELLNSQS